MQISEEQAQQFAATLAENLRQAMAKTRQSTRTLAKESGVTRSTITRILAAQDGLPTARAVFALETTLGVAIWPGPAAVLT